MKKTIFFSMLAAVLIGAMSMGFSSYSSDNEPDLTNPSDAIMGKWYYDTRYYLEFKRDNTYSYVTEKGTINGLYKIREIEKTTLTSTDSYIEDGNVVERTTTYEANLLKMLVSGSDVYDNFWVYEYKSVIGTKQLMVHLYSGDKLVQKLRTFTSEKDFVANNVLNKDIVRISNINGGISIVSDIQGVMTVYTVSGQMVYKNSFINQQDLLLPRGIYIVSVNNVVKKVFVE